MRIEVGFSDYKDFALTYVYDKIDAIQTLYNCVVADNVVESIELSPKQVWQHRQADGSLDNLLKGETNKMEKKSIGMVLDNNNRWNLYVGNSDKVHEVVLSKSDSQHRSVRSYVNEVKFNNKLDFYKRELTNPTVYYVS